MAFPKPGHPSLRGEIVGDHIAIRRKVDNRVAFEIRLKPAEGLVLFRRGTVDDDPTMAKDIADAYDRCREFTMMVNAQMVDVDEITAIANQMPDSVIGDVPVMVTDHVTGERVEVVLGIDKSPFMGDA